MFRLLLLSLQCLTALAAPWDPQPITPTPSLAGVSISPIITSVSDTRLHGEGAELKKREYGDICGYVSLNKGMHSVTCSVGDRCAINTGHAALGCCPFNDFQNCALPTQCLGYAELSLCDTSCASDYYIAKCTETAYPYCATYRSMHNGNTLQGYECADVQTLLALTESSVDGTTSTPAVVEASSVASPVPAPIANFIFNNITNTTYNNNNTNTNSNRTEVNAPEDKKKLSKGELAGTIVGSITGAIALVALFVACIKK